MRTASTVRPASGETALRIADGEVVGRVCACAGAFVKSTTNTNASAETVDRNLPSLSTAPDRALMWRECIGEAMDVKRCWALTAGDLSQESRHTLVLQRSTERAVHPSGRRD